jgi:terminal oxidase subunit
VNSKEKWEWGFTLSAIILLALVAATTFPYIFQVGGVPAPHLTNDAPVIQVHLIQRQYVFQVEEEGPKGNSSYYNLILTYPSYLLNLTATSIDVTGNLYFPYYSGQVIDVQIVPGTQAYAVILPPSVPGPYVFLNGEYDGPWFPYQVAVILELPSSGYFTLSDVSRYYEQTQQARAGALVGDPYNPPVILCNSTFEPRIYLSADQYGILNFTVPAPTLVVKEGANVSLVLFFPFPTSDSNYLRTYVNGRPEVVNNATLGIYGVSGGTLKQVASVELRYGVPIILNFTAVYPAYVYGIYYPIHTNYSPGNTSSPVIGEDFGLVTGAWGIIMVEGG